MNHFGLPVNPLPGRSINLGGEHETDYLGFEDFVTGAVIGPPRPFTTTLGDHSVQNLCLRDAPISMNGWMRDSTDASLNALFEARLKTAA